MKLEGEEKHLDDHGHGKGGHGKDHGDDHHGHHHHHGHGHGHLSAKELNWKCRIFLTLEEPDFRSVGVGVCGVSAVGCFGLVSSVSVARS